MALLKTVGILVGIFAVGALSDNCYDGCPTALQWYETPQCPAGTVPNDACGKCKCACPDEMQVYFNGTCAVAAGSTCDNAENQCTDGATCTDQDGDGDLECVCNGDRKEEFGSGKCLHLKGQTCQDSSECEKGVGLYCSDDKICTCEVGSGGINGPCFKDIGSTCTSDKECNSATNKDLICSKNGTCTCRFWQTYNQKFDPMSENPAMYTMPGMAPTSKHLLGRCEIPLGKRCNMMYPNQCADRTCGYPSYRCECRQNAEYVNGACVCKNNTITVGNQCNCYSGAMWDPFNGCNCPAGIPELNTILQRCDTPCQPNTSRGQLTGICECNPGYHLSWINSWQQECVKDAPL